MKEKSSWWEAYCLGGKKLHYQHCRLTFYSCSQPLPQSSTSYLDYGMGYTYDLVNSKLTSTVET